MDKVVDEVMGEVVGEVVDEVVDGWKGTSIGFGKRMVVRWMVVCEMVGL